MNIEEKPFSDTLSILLRYSKRVNREVFTFKSIKEVLAKEYHSNMRLKDVMLVLNNAFIEMLNQPKFEIPNKDKVYLEIINHPIDSYNPLCKSGNKNISIFGPGLDDSFTVEQFYDKIIEGYMQRFMLTNIKWCYDYLFPKEE